MNRIVAASVLLLLVLGAAFYRSRIALHPLPLPRSKNGVVLLTAANFDVVELTDTTHLPHLVTLAKQNPAGLLPTRNGTTNEGNTSAALQVLLAGSRAPKQDAPRLPQVVRGDWLSVPATATQIITAANRARAGSVLSIACDLRETADRNRFDALLTSLIAEQHGLPAGWSLLIVGVTPTREAIAQRERVSPVLLWQRDRNYSAPPLLTSPSVRNCPGLVASTDIAATVASLLGLPAEQQHIGDGRTMEIVAFPQDRIPYLILQATGWGMQAREQKLLPALPWFLAALLLISTFVPWEALQRVTHSIALIAPAAIIAATLLIPVSAAIPAWLLYIVAALPTITLALFVRSTSLPFWIAAATVILIAGDTVMGGPILSRTPLSYSVLEAARFYGIGNEVSGLLLGASVIAVGRYFYAPLPAGKIAAGLCGLALAILSGAPMLGADAGGFVATLLAFAALSLSPETKRPAGRRALLTVLLVGSVIVSVVITFAMWDAGRGIAERTHVGEAVAAMQAQGIGAITSIAQRKIAVNARLLVTSPWAVLFVTEIGILLWVARAKQQARQPEVVSPANVFPAVIALCTASLALCLLNDSGTVAAATCGLWFFAIRNGSPPLLEYRQ